MKWSHNEKSRQRPHTSAAHASTNGSPPAHSIHTNEQSVNGNLIAVPGFGQFKPEVWARMTNWAVSIILDAIDNDKQPDGYTNQARRWLHAVGITSLDQVRSIAGTVRCEFCHTPLTATRSKVLGRGPECSRKNGLQY